MPVSSRHACLQAYQNCSRLLLAALALLLAALALLLAACSLPPPASGEAEASAWQAPVDASAWPVIEDESRLRVFVYPAGPLAGFGHAHVIDWPLRGTLYRGETNEGSGFRLAVPVDAAVVDEPAARAASGEQFSASVSGAARAGTRRNLLGEDMLDAERFPLIRIESLRVTGELPEVDVMARLQLRGQWFEQEFRATVTPSGDALRVEAELQLTQSGLGMEQYSALGGGLKVADEFRARLSILARPAD